MKKAQKANMQKAIITLVIMAIITIIGYINPNLQEVILDVLGIKRTESNATNTLSTVSNRTETSFDLESIPEYTDKPFVYINDNKPFFTEKDYTTTAFEKYSELDSLGRCGVAYANICKEIMPKSGEKRESISSVKPSGWKNVSYQGIVENDYLYNRAHLIGWQLAGENANKLNLITGTRYMNVQGMLPFEDMVDDYFEKYSNRNNHVLYRVTPIFEGDNLVASGVQMEAYSVEDNGKGVCFNVYVYNVQPQIEINYKTGESRLIK